MSNEDSGAGLNADTPRRPIIIHYHLFKNAGTSVDAILLQNFGAAWTSREYPPRSTPDAARQFLMANPHIAALSSHTLPLPPPAIPDAEILPILFIRHPLDRLKSAYLFEREQQADTVGSRLARLHDFAGYLCELLALPGERSCRNFQTQRFAMGEPPESGIELDRALRAFERLPFVGSVEAFEPSLAALESMIKPWFPEFRVFHSRENASRTPSNLEQRLAQLRRELGDEIFQMITAANADDLQLYERALARYTVQKVPLQALPANAVPPERSAGVDDAFVFSLYDHLMRRAPSEAEVTNGRQLAAQVLFQQLIETPEYKWRRGVATEWPPGFYHSPVVNPESVRGYVSERVTTAPEAFLGIDFDVNGMQRLLDANVAMLRLQPFHSEKAAGKRFYLNGSFFPYGDALSLLVMLAHFRPSKIVEIGSGFSTACMLDSADLLGLSELRITCIEPYPTRLKGFLRPEDYSRVTLVEAALQAVPVGDIVDPLDANDFLFIDSTHVLKTGSDVHYELFDILPKLKSKVIIHFHDCPYPFEYPDQWIFEKNYSWNELYALRAFLMYNRLFKVLFWPSMLQQISPEKLRAADRRFGTCEHTSLWLTKTA